MTARRTVFFLAFGTQGDVQPLAVLAHNLSKQHPTIAIHFGTHAVLKPSISPILGHGTRIVFHGISSPPVALRSSQAAELAHCNEGVATDCMKGETTTEKSDKASGLPPQESIRNVGIGWEKAAEVQHRKECLQAVQVAFGDLQETEGSLIVFNLFALEAWHLAEYLRVHCIAAAPYVVPYCAPSEFEGVFRRSNPHLYQRLQEAVPEELGWGEVVHWMWPLFSDRWGDWRESSLGLSPCPLTDPVTELPQEHTWPAPTPLLYGFSPSIVECPAYWPKSVKPCGFWFPPSKCKDWERAAINPSDERGSSAQFSALKAFLTAGERAGETPPVLFGFSAIGSMGLLSRPRTLLEVITGCLSLVGLRGILLTSGHSPLHDAIMDSHRDLDSSASRRSTNPFAAGASGQSLGGSHDMQSRRTDGDYKQEREQQQQGNELGENVKAARGLGMEELRDSGHVHRQTTDAYPSMSRKRMRTFLASSGREQAAWEENCGPDGHLPAAGVALLAGRLLCLPGAVPHDWLLPQCSIVLHHGGSGTTAAALHAGIPQVICPFILDQFYWAERMAWIGVAPVTLTPSQLMPTGSLVEKMRAAEAVALALRTALGPDMKQRAAELGQQIRRENGVIVAMEVMMSQLFGK